MGFWHVGYKWSLIPQGTTGTCPSSTCVKLHGLFVISRSHLHWSGCLGLERFGVAFSLPLGVPRLRGCKRRKQLKLGTKSNLLFSWAGCWLWRSMGHMSKGTMG